MYMKELVPWEHCIVIHNKLINIKFKISRIYNCTNVAVSDVSLFPVLLILTKYSIRSVIIYCRRKFK